MRVLRRGKEKWLPILEAKGESFEVGRVSLTSLGYVYAVSHCTEANSGKLQAGGKIRKKKRNCWRNTDSNYCFQNNKPVINFVHRSRKDLAQRREQILTCGHKANSQLAFWEKSYVSWAQHLQDFQLFQGKPISPCIYKPFLYSNIKKFSHHAVVRKMQCCYCSS